MFLFLEKYVPIKKREIFLKKISFYSGCNEMYLI